MPPEVPRMSPKNVAINISLNPKTFEQLESLVDSPILKSAKKVSLVHIYNKESQSSFLPCKNGHTLTLEDVEKHVTKKLSKFRELLHLDTEIEIKVIFNRDAKIKVLEYLEQNKTDLVVVSTRGEMGVEGLFKNSFSFWLVEHAPCDVYVVRPVH